MASRLPVVIAQCATRSSRATEFEEQMVADLIFANGLDVSLIAPLKSIEFGSTDHLCLEGLLGDFAILGWDVLEASAQEFSRLQISGRMAVTSFQPQDSNIVIGESVSPKRIYHYDLNTIHSPAVMMRELQRLLDDRNQRTIGIGLTPKRPAQSPNSDPIQPSTVVLTRQPVPPQVEPSAKSPVVNPFLTPVTPNKSELPLELAGEDDPWKHLDQLVEDLDATSL